MIAIITPWERTFKNFSHFIVDTTVQYVHIKNIEDCRGKEFIGYSVLYDYREINDIDKLIQIVISRIK